MEKATKAKVGETICEHYLNPMHCIECNYEQESIKLADYKKLQEENSLLKQEIETLKNRFLEVGDDTKKLYQEGYEKLQQEVKEYREALELASQMNDNIFTKGNVDWGKTFSIKWDLINNAMLSVDEVLKKYEEK